MAEQHRRSISELLADHELITAAIRRGIRQAVLNNAKLGRPASTWRDGKVVYIPPEEVIALLSKEEDT